MVCRFAGRSNRDRTTFFNREREPNAKRPSCRLIEFEGLKVFADRIRYFSKDNRFRIFDLFRRKELVLPCCMATVRTVARKVRAGEAGARLDFEVPFAILIW